MDPPENQIIPKRKINHTYNTKALNGDEVKCDVEIILVDDRIAIFKTFIDKNGKELTVRGAWTYEQLSYKIKE